jgi:lipoprotein-anchoring transpeptidase ErfK/SrfK
VTSTAASCSRRPPRILFGVCDLGVKALTGVAGDGGAGRRNHAAPPGTVTPVLPIRRILLTASASAIVLATTPASASPPLPTEPIAPGVTAAGVDLSGLTVDQAAQRLEALSDRLQRGSVLVEVADKQFKLRSSTAGVVFDPLTTAKRAVYAGRAAQGAPVEVALAVTHAQKTVQRFTDRVNRTIRRAPRDSRAIITLKRVRVTHSKTGRNINAAALAQRLGKALDDPRIERVFKIKVRKVKPTIDAKAARKTVSTVITIKQSTFTLRLFKHQKVVRTYKVAVGQPGYPTPNGRFSIQSKQIDPVWSVPNSPWAGELAGTTVGGGSAANPLKARWMGVSGSVGIHGTGQDYSIGTRASHGCIRMHVSDVKLLYRRVPLGTPVLIGR